MKSGDLVMTLVLLIIWCARRWGSKENKGEGQQENLLQTILGVFHRQPVKAAMTTDHP